MHLLLLRHGIAEDVGPAGDDASRRLTSEGVHRTREVLRGLALFASRPDAILTSPLVRARQTAEIAAEFFDRTPRILNSLATGPAQSVVADLRKVAEETVMLVGHEPTLGRIAAILCAGPGCEPDFVQLKKAGCACVEASLNGTGAAPRGVLHWLTTPRMLRG